MDQLDTVTTILVHFNTPAETEACLNSLLQLTVKTFQHNIIVVDNGSKDPLHLDQKFVKAGVQLLRSESNLGFSGGNNVALTQAIEDGCDYVMLLNNDTHIAPTAVEELLAAARKTPEAAVFNPKIYFTKGMEYHYQSYTDKQRGNVIWFGGGSVDWSDAASFHRGVDEVDRGQLDAGSETDFATGCCMLVRTSLLEAIGLLDEDLFLYWEDVEFSLRTLKAGHQLRFVPTAEVWHDNAGSSDGAGSEISQYYQTRNRIYVSLKYGGITGKKAAAHVISQALNGNSAERQAALDAMTGKMGKWQLR